MSLSFQVAGYTGFSLRIFMFYSPSVSSQISHGSCLIMASSGDPWPLLAALQVYFFLKFQSHY